MDAIAPDEPATEKIAPAKLLPERRLWQLGAWRLLASLSAASCLAIVPAVAALSEGPPLLPVAVGMTLLGSILAQGCLLAAWLAWGDLPFGRRLRQHWLVAGVLCLLWLAGLLGAAPGVETPAVGFTAAMTVPLISLAAQIPLWAMRHVFGWRLVRVHSGELPEREQPWSIRDLFLATLIAALSLGLARLSPAFLQEHDFWIVWAIGGTVASVVTCITILPAAIWLLRVEPFRRGVLYSCLYAGLAVALEWGAVAAIRRLGLTVLPPYFAFVGLSLLILSFAGTVILAAHAPRALGYRLITRKGKRSTKFIATSQN
jgi:hypothetical protein